VFKRVSHTFAYVLDQDQALEFYVGKLGMVVHTDADLGAMRFLTVAMPGDAGLEVGLMVPGPPLHDEATAAQVRELLTKGAGGGGLIFESDDCVGDYERLRAAGVEFTQAPTERFYGTECALRDPFGNPVRFTQLADPPTLATP
jgi:catechol 2,3-dioxygenase-like lactoylglutathione lyase family enzyme